jgi:6-methylsalicylate decarboxylase
MVEVGPVVDCHQHIWPEAFVEALRSRSVEPMLRGWELLLTGEPPYVVNAADHEVDTRGKVDRADDVDLVLYSLSAPLGIETMPPEQAEPLLTAWHSLADDLQERSEEGPVGQIWAAAGLVEPDLTRLAELLRRPTVCGLQVPATAMATPAALERLAPVLAVAEWANRPVLVHPGPASLDGLTSVNQYTNSFSVGDGRQPAGELPGWWPALASYPAQQAAAWFAWQVAGRALLPQLRIGFVGLAGLAPLHHERLAQRGGRLGPIDRLVFYETSSYGMRAMDALLRVVGVDALVHGSDRPYAVPTDPGLGAAFSQALFVTNPERFLKGDKP